MKSNFLIAIVLLLPFLSSISIAQQEYEDHRIFLLGNLEELSSNASEFKALELAISRKPTPYSIIVNGDFVGATGWSSPPKPEEQGRVDRLISLASAKGGSIIFVPGDKEWDNGHRKGWKKIKALERYIESKLGKAKAFFPQKGCLGPEVVDVSNHVRVVAINSQWFMQQHRPEEEDAICSFATDMELWDELGSILTDSENKNVIVAIHHPLLSYGQYAGYKLGAMHLAPPIIGTFMAAHRRHVGGDRGLNNTALKSFSNSLLTLSKEHQGVIFTSGHEYDLQVLYQDGNYHINSGALSKSRPVAKKAETIFSKNSRGIAKLNFLRDGEVNVDILELTKRNELSNTYHKKLFSAPCTPNKDEFISPNHLFTPCQESSVIVSGKVPDFSKNGNAVASADYSKGRSGQFWLGKLYRVEWGTEIHNIPYLDIGTKEGGLIPYSRGGAAETTSLKFKTTDGRRYSFRSVDKHPQRKLDEAIAYTAIGKAFKDLTAHQHPYGAIATKTFLNELDLQHSNPTLYIMPDDPRLGIYQEEFAGMLGTFEVKPWSKKKNREGFNGADKISSTFEMYRKLIDDYDSKIDKEKFLNARLFDIWLADWDRHEDNWKWLTYEEEKGLRYEVFPKDKDKVLGVLNGLYAVIDWEWVSPNMASIREDYRGLKSLNFKTRHMDRWLLSEVTYEEWLKEAEQFKALMTDEVIDRALKKMPTEVYDISAEEIKRVLKIRRDLLPEAIKDYYNLLSTHALVVGSNEKEIFNIERLKNGDVHIRILKDDKDKKGKPFKFDRLFKRKETKEIRIYGLGKKDVFNIAGTSNKSIPLRIVSGNGDDTIEDKSKIRGGKSTFVYDFHEEDKVNLGTEGKLVKTSEEINFNTQNLFNYNYALTLPQIGFNSDDRFIAGITYSNTKQGFGKSNFSSKTSFSGVITSNKNFNIAYNQTIRRASSTWDIILDVKAANRNRSFQRFYGLGNETVFSNELKLSNFYRNTTRKYTGNFGFKKEFWGRSYFTPSIRVEHNKVSPRSLVENGESIYDGLPASIGLGVMTLLGPQFELCLDLTNSAYLPTRGVRFKMQNFSFFNSSEDLGLGGNVAAEGSLFLSTGNYKPVTLSFRGGYSKAYGDTPFYHKSSIGQQANHRGYFRNRFIGDSAAFLNTDLRFHLGSIRTPLLPIKYGIMGLYDIGRVWINNEMSTSWHGVWGGGFYLVPWQEKFSLNFTYAKSEESAIISFGLGVSVN
ncbi:MAG: hypothetical protein ACI9P5_003897 [Saprospiraceae bacterium]|jgi:hypothetical protein